MNLPIYRAKKIDADEWVEGGLSPCGKFIIKHLSEHKMPYPMDTYYLTCHYPNYEEVDQNTLAIHFPNMIDKNGKKIFASLSKDGVGGDVMKWTDKIKGVCSFYNSSIDLRIIINKKIGARYDTDITDCKVIGIHKGVDNDMFT